MFSSHSDGLILHHALRHKFLVSTSNITKSGHPKNGPGCVLDFSKPVLALGGC